MSSLIGVTSVTLLGALSMTSVLGAVIFSPIILSLFVMSCLLWLTILLTVVGYQYHSSDSKKKRKKGRLGNDGGGRDATSRIRRLRNRFTMSNRRDAWKAISNIDAKEYLHPEEREKLELRQRAIREHRRDIAFNEVSEKLNETFDALSDVRREQGDVLQPHESTSMQQQQPGRSLSVEDPTAVSQRPTADGDELRSTLVPVDRPINIWEEAD